MTIMEYLEKVFSSSMKEKNFAEELYQTTLTGEIKKITDRITESLEFESDEYLRLLSAEEIKDASKDMNVDFISSRIIPIFDTGDNDYISYDLSTLKWCKFNIVEELRFSQKASIIEFFI